MHKFNSIAIALAAASAVSTAYAQSSVTLYGIVDGGVEHVRTSDGAAGKGGTLTSMVTGSSAASRLGFRGTEDLGGGMKATFVLESGFDLDSGGTTGAAFFGRDSYVGLGGSWGELRLGRTYTPAFWVILGGDVNRLGLYGNAGTYSQLGPSGHLRANNGLNYISPNMGGFVVRATYSMGNESASAPKDSGRIYGVSGEYKKDAISAGVFHQVRRDVFPANSASSQANTYSGIAGAYDFGQFTLGGGYTRNDPAGPDTGNTGLTTGWWLGGKVALGGGQLSAQYGALKIDTNSGTKPQANLLGIGYIYPLSKRTSLYSTYGQMTNNSTGKFALEASSRTVALPAGAGSDATGLVVGIRHNF